MCVIKVAFIIDELILFFPRYALSFSIDKIPDRYFLNFSISMKWCKRSLLFVSEFFLFHVKSCIHPLYNWIVSSWILKKKLLMCFRWFFCAICKYIHNDLVKNQSNRHKTQEIVITYVVLFNWKNIICGAQFHLIWRC